MFQTVILQLSNLLLCKTYIRASCAHTINQFSPPIQELLPRQFWVILSHSFISHQKVILQSIEDTEDQSRKSIYLHTPSTSNPHLVSLILNYCKTLLTYQHTSSFNKKPSEEVPRLPVSRDANHRGENTLSAQWKA